MAAKVVNRVTVSALLGILILFTTLWHTRDHILDAVKQHTSKGAYGYQQDTSMPVANPPISKSQRPSFLEIAQKHGTDKVTPHHYNHLYEKYLEPIRDKPLKMLEIGLGCDMSYGPGASYHTWLEFFPNVDLYYIEYDAACAQKWANETTGATIFTGDQADKEFLARFIQESGGGFDIIIDDGGHTMNQQITSLQALYGIVLPGGIYFCEDLATSYLPKYGGGEGKNTMMGMIKDLLDDLNSKTSGGSPVKYPVGSQMRSIECGEEICAFFKK